jgi:hypothetical protein
LPRIHIVPQNPLSTRQNAYWRHSLSQDNYPELTLLMFCPADRREGYFEGMAELTREKRRPTREELVDLMRRFDQEPVDEP